MIRTTEADAPPFPNPGSIAFVGGSGEKVQILQRNADGSSLVKKLGPQARFEGASRDRREPNSNLFAKFDDALRFKQASAQRRRAKKAAAR